MDIYKEAAKAQLRVSTTKGALSTEQLFGLSIEELDTLAVQLDEAYASSGKKSFVNKKSVKDKGTKLAFDIVFDVLQTKIAEKDAADAEKEKKAHNERILEIIADKEDQSLQGKSIKQLKDMLQ